VFGVVFAGYGCRLGKKDAKTGFYGCESAGFPSATCFGLKVMRRASRNRPSDG